MRGFAPSPQTRRYTFLPNMRLWDKDAMAIFAIVRAGEFDSDNMFLTPDYVNYLVRNRTPTLPAWFLAGLMGLYPQIKFYRETLRLEPAPDGRVFVRDSGTHPAGTGAPRWRALERIRRGFGEGPG